MIIEARWDFHSNAEQKFWQDVLRYKITHKETSDAVTFHLIEDHYIKLLAMTQ